MNVELRQMRYFVAVAEELNFTRAAERLHMTQQPLSAAIAQLERALGVRLFERTTRHVALTEAGVAFLAGARDALAAADAAAQAAIAAGRGLTGCVSLGISSGAWYGLGELFAAVAAEHPGIHLDVRQQSARPAIRAVRAEALDAAVVLCDAAPNDLDGCRLKDEPVVVVLPANHPCAGRDAVHLDEVEHMQFALDDPAEGPGYNAAVIAVCGRAGFKPLTVEVQTHHDAWERAIADGRCVGLTTASSLHVAHPGVCAVPVAPPATFPLDLVWRTESGGRIRPAAQAVLETAEQTADRYGWRG